MRNVLILLAVVAALILVLGALNSGTTFEIDYVAGTVTAVSLFWVSVVIAALVFVAGLAAAWLALSAAASARRKLEADLQSTYERLRETEALAARQAAAASEAVPVVAVAAGETMIAGEDQTIVTGEDQTLAEEEPTTVAEAPARTEATAVTAAATPAAEASGSVGAGDEDEEAGDPGSS